MSNLSFLAAGRLWLLVAPLVLLVAYLVLQRTRRRYAMTFTNLELLDVVAPDRPGWRRHLPAAALVLGLVAGVAAFARPAVASEQASKDAVVILAVDTSLSMQATDVAPSRVDAAKEAAGSFLRNVPDGIKVGVVAFDGSAQVALAPTADLGAVQRTIDGLRLGQGTAIGEAVYTSLDAIDSAFARNGDGASRTASNGSSSKGDTSTESKKAAATVVLLSDGETTQGRPNDEAAAAARDRGITVNTIAFGTSSGTVVAPDGQTVKVPVNSSALADLARTTGGQPLEATSAEQLKQVYTDLGKAVSSEPVTREVGDWFTFAALILVVLAAAGSLLWFSRLP